MIQEIHIHRFILSHNIHLAPKKGFNVFTGETGAGKTLLINAIRFGIGDTIHKDLLINLEDPPHVQISFHIPKEKIMSSDDYPYSSSEWVCERFLTPSGKNRTKVNGIIVPLKEYKKKLRQLIAIHGQHDTSQLFSRKFQLSMFDQLFFDELGSLIAFIKSNRDLLVTGKEKLALNEISEKERQQEIDFLRFQIDEIEKSQIQNEDEEKLFQDKQLLSHSQQIIETIDSIRELFSDDSRSQSSMDSLFSQAIHLLTGISTYSDILRQSSETFQTIRDMLRDLMHDLNHEQEQLQNNYHKDVLDQIVLRIDEIQRLKRKYGQDIPSILKTKEEFQLKLQKLQDQEHSTASLQEEIKSLEKEMIKQSFKLSEARKKLKPKFENAVKKELSKLGMDKVKFEICFEYENRSGYSSIQKDYQDYFLFENGIDAIHFLIATNPGSALLPLAKIASGGELSRVMLAIQAILGQADRTPSLIFDEIDSGVGGQMGHLIGQKLQSLSDNHQILCITHLPQIAAKAHHHFSISKNIQENSTQIDVQFLCHEERILEISRMTAGDQLSDISQQHALEMLKKGHHEKNSS